MTYEFKKAVPVWGRDLKHEYNQFLGFHTRIKYSGKMKLAVAARSYYRLYLNGEMQAHGPARAGKGFCRVDEMVFSVEGETEVAIEAAAYDKTVKYCNDCTLESGLLCCEITGEDGSVLAATGEDSFRYTELLFRRDLVETMSHSRGILEFCDYEKESFLWREGEAKKWCKPAAIREAPEFLVRRAPYPSYRKIKMSNLAGICDLKPGNGKDNKERVIAKTVNAKWYAMLPAKNCFVSFLAGEEECRFTGTFKLLSKDCVLAAPGERPAAITWELPQTELGFISLQVEAKGELVLDVIHTDHKEPSGDIRGNSYASRYCLKPGRYSLITFEPKLVRYVRLVLRTGKEVQVNTPEIVDYTYPDTNEGSFSCSDGDLNRIYEAARRTLRLNTLDIFMDCPERERGGWLCDSYFTAGAAWQMLGNLSVEEDFIENFMLTDPREMHHGFFPEVYPGVRNYAENVGIQNWSFWLLAQVYEFAKRSGKKEMVESFYPRIEAFMDGMLSLKGESGLLEGLTEQFVDWSLSNNPQALNPISVPVNCLAVYVLDKMAELYGREDWKVEAQKMRRCIEEIDTDSLIGGAGDSAFYKTVPFGPQAGRRKLCRGDFQTESGVALELWSGFRKDDDQVLRQFVYSQGYAPKFRPDPNVGKANLFIGGMVRLDTLARMKRIPQLVEEIKEIYLQQLRDGSGTFFEYYQEMYGCHGFNGYIGKLLTNHVLGLGEPMQETKTVCISPNPCGLRWANGSAKVEDGIILMNWQSDLETRTLKVYVTLPGDWSYELEIPDGLSGWKVYVNDCQLS